LSKVIRSNKPTDHYVIIRNEFLRDARLSLKARGLGAWMMTHSDGWNLSLRSISAQTGAGIDAVASGLRELEALGYLQREQTVDEQGRRGGMDYEISDVPSRDPRLTPWGETPDVDTAPGEAATGEDRDRKTRVRPVHTLKKNISKKTNKQEDQLEESSTPGGALANDAVPALFAEPEPEPTQAKPKPPADDLARWWYDANGGLVNYMAARGVIKKGLGAGHSPDAIRAALARLKAKNLGLSAETLRRALTDKPSNRDVAPPAEWTPWDVDAMRAETARIQAAWGK
jgi:hypothetical protein